MNNVELMLGNCLDRLKDLDDNSVDSIVTDPPYGLSFMGKKWDYDVPAVEIWEECLRVLKPGGHLLAFAGTRTQHRMAVNIEDAGFEIRDMIAWVYGSGFPKSHNISKAIDKMAGAEREVVGKWKHPTLKDTTKVDRQSSTQYHANNSIKDEWDITAPATPEAQQWDGWGTALKPALEPITVARKPISEKTVAGNVLKYGTGGINVDGCRISTSDSLGGGMVSKGRPKASEGWDRPWMHDPEVTEAKKAESAEKVKHAEALGRFPANLIHDGSDEVVDLFPNTKSGKPGVHGGVNNGAVYGGIESRIPGTPMIGLGDEGSASRFFYCAKASKSDRDEGLDQMEEQQFVQWQTGNGASGKPSSMSEGRDTKRKNTHPTVKPTELMRYLVRLVTPKGGVVLDPFMGSGSTGKAAKLEGFDFIGIEMDEEYMEIAKARIQAAEPEVTLDNFFE